MQKTTPILASLLLSASSLLAQAAATNPQIFGTWVSVRRSVGGVGALCTFRPQGEVEMGVGAVMETWYMVRGNKLIQPSESLLAGGAPQVTTFQIAGDVLTLKGEKGETSLKRIEPLQKGAAPIVGLWRNEPSTTESPMSGAILEFTRDGLTKIRLPVHTVVGTYDLMAHTFTLPAETPEGTPPTRRYRLEKGLMIVTRPDGKTEDLYVRADASKEELRRSGVRYGEKAAELDPPPELTKKKSF